MSSLTENFKLLLIDFDAKTVDYAFELFNSSKPDYLHSNSFFILSRDKYFVKRLAVLYKGGDSGGGEKIIEILSFMGTSDSLSELINIFLSGDARTRACVEKNLIKYGYGYIDHYSKLKIIYKSNPDAVALMDGIVSKSGFYEDLKDLLESPDEKIILYALKQYHKYCDNKVIEVLKKFKKDSNWMIRFNVLQVVKKIETPDALNLMLDFLADDNIKLREEAKTFIISNYKLFADKITDHIDNPGSIGDLSYFQGILEIFEYHPDFSRLFQIIKIVVEFPKGVSLKARTVLFNILKSTHKTKELALDRDSERYKLIGLVINQLCQWNSDQAVKFISRLVDNFGCIYIDVLCRQYFSAENREVTNLINEVFRGNQYFIKDRAALLELCQTLDIDGIEQFIKLLVENKVKEIIPSFAKVFENLCHKRTVELYRIFTENGLNAKGFGLKYKKDINKFDPAARIECIEALGFLKDPELLGMISADWKTYQREVKNFALDSIEKNFLNETAVKLLNQIFLHEEDHEFKERSLQLLAGIESPESTEIILKAFASPGKTTAAMAAKILVEKGRGRLMSQIDVLPDKLKEELFDISIKNDGKFLDEIEAQVVSTDPKARNQIIKLLTYLSKNERSKTLSLLKKFVKNPDPYIRADFTKLMEIVGGPEIVEYLIPLINDENPRVKANAIEVIAALNLREISNMLLPLTSHVNNRVRANAIIALYKLGNPNVVVGLSEMLRSPDKWMRASATYALGEISDPRVLPLLYTVLNDGDPDVIKNAFRVIKKNGDSDSIKHLTKFLNHENKSIKNAASETINHLRKETVNKN
jgi:HEAT repeat protein